MAFIYIIKNIKNDKVYIGSAINIKSRWRTHRRQLRKGIHHSKYLQRAYNKYKSSSFIFEIIEDNIDENSLLEREQFYLDTILFAKEDNQKFYQFGYNVCRVAGSRLGVKHSKETKEKLRYFNLGKKHSIESIKKMRLQQTGEKNGFFGKKHTEETKQKIRDKVSGENSPRYGKSHSDSAKKAISEAQSGNGNSMYGKTHTEEYKNKRRMGILQYDIEGALIQKWNSIKEAQEALGISGISTGIKNNKIRGGFYWKEDPNNKPIYKKGL